VYNTATNMTENHLPGRWIDMEKSGPAACNSCWSTFNGTIQFGSSLCDFKS